MNLPALARGHGFVPWSGRIPHAAGLLSSYALSVEPVLRAPGAAAEEPASCSYRGPCAWSLGSARREAAAVRSPGTSTKSSPGSLRLEKAHTQR